MSESAFEAGITARDLQIRITDAGQVHAYDGLARSAGTRNLPKLQLFVLVAEGLHRILCLVVCPWYFGAGTSKPEVQSTKDKVPGTKFKNFLMRSTPSS